MQQQIWLTYQESHPDEFILLGPDVMASGTNGVALAQFRINAGGLTFPLLRDCADGSVLSDTNLVRPYNQRDNYVVIDGDGVIRYHADDFWDYGNRLHLDELVAAIGGAMADLLDVPPARGGAMSLTVSPNPASGPVAFTLRSAASSARFQVLDLAGREVSAVTSATTGEGTARVVWDGRDRDGRPLPADMYLVRVLSGTTQLTRRVVLTR